MIPSKPIQHSGAAAPAYAELHCLSNFSFQRGASQPEELVQRAHALGYAALALTDECSVAGVVRAHVEAKRVGVQLVPGAEFRVPYVQAGAEAIVMTASGCGAMVKEYGHLLANDPHYAARAQRITELTKDLSEILPAFQQELAKKVQIKKRVAYHPPCTLQHGQQIRGKVEEVLRAVGVDVTLCSDSHLCCGSAGTYSVLQPELSYQLRDNKLKNLQATQSEMIVSANIGCLTHLQSGTESPVRHWIELIDQAM